MGKTTKSLMIQFQVFPDRTIPTSSSTPQIFYLVGLILANPSVRSTPWHIENRLTFVVFPILLLNREKFEESGVLRKTTDSPLHIRFPRKMKKNLKGSKTFGHAAVQDMKTNNTPKPIVNILKLLEEYSSAGFDLSANRGEMLVLLFCQNL